MGSLFISISQWSIPLLIIIVLGVGFKKKVPVYEVFIQGVMDGIKTTIKLTPYILAIFVATGVFRASGALDHFIQLFQPLLNLLKLPPDLLTLGILKPLSGSASLGITSEILNRYGPDSPIGLIASLAQGSSETTFYIFSLYLGVAGIKNSRHILAMGLVSEVFTFLLALMIGLLIIKL